MISITPNVGSIGGSKIIAKIEGLGPLVNTTQEYWNAHGGTLVNNATDEDICAQVIVKSYSEVECITKPGSIDNGTAIAAKSYESNDQLDCVNTNPALCLYEQVEGASFPVVTSISNDVAG